MPEFAEVDYQVKWLRERATGWEITSFDGTAKGQFPELKDRADKGAVLKNFFEGARVDAVTQRGKFVVFRMSTGVLIAHLMFKGRWSIKGDDFRSNYKGHKEAPTPGSVNFWMEGPKGRLNFHEPEHMGKVHAFPGILPGACEDLSELGPEVLITPETDPDYAGRDWDVKDLVKATSKSKTAIKSLLLDQKKQAGLGNMYVCEALYRARINPGRPSNSLSGDEVARLHQEARAVVKLSIDSGLDYGQALQVYKKEQDPQGHTVECSQVGGRDTYWVPDVQK